MRSWPRASRAPTSARRSDWTRCRSIATGCTSPSTQKRCENSNRSGRWLVIDCPEESCRSYSSWRCEPLRIDLEKQRFSAGKKPRVRKARESRMLLPGRSKASRQRRKRTPSTTDAAQPPPAEVAQAAIPRRPSAEVAREVYARDEGQCTFVAEDGRRCGARDFIEFDHIDPHGLGGDPTVQNLRLRCRAHNQLYARQVYGDRAHGDSRRTRTRTTEKCRLIRAEQTSQRRALRASGFPRSGSQRRERFRCSRERRPFFRAGV